MNRFEIRPYRPGDESHINASFNEVFHEQRLLDQWRWKFQPVGQNSLIMLAVAPDGAVLSQFSVQVMRLQIDDKAYPAGHAVDEFCVHNSSTVQGRAYLRTYRAFIDAYCRDDRIALFFGFPGDRHMRLGRLRMNYVDPVPVRCWGKRRGWRLWPGRKAAAEFPRERDLDGLWQRCRHRYRVALVRDGSWLQRRYFSRPGVDYEFVTVSRGHDMCAWAIVQRAQDQLKWVDLLWDGGRKDDLIRLEEKITRLARQCGIPEMSLWLMGDGEAEQVLGACGWQERPHPLNLHLTIVPFHPEISTPYVMKHFYVTMGDSDLV
jgi:hypothetical protein